jgi:hypothetical protein
MSQKDSATPASEKPHAPQSKRSVIRRGHKLTPELQARVVERLAAYEWPIAIARSLKRDYGIDIRRQSIEYYDPTKHAGRARPEKRATLFREMRARLLEGKAGIGLASRILRLIALDRMARDQIVASNTREARALLEQIANEVHGIAHRPRDRRRRREDPIAARTISDLDRARAIAVLLNKVKAMQSNDAGNAP